MSPRRTFAGFLIGLLAIQAAWIAAMPAFRGPDEFDHVYRADGVAHGAIMPGLEDHAVMRGQLTPVRASVIEAAEPVCDFYQYTLYYNCHPYRSASTGTWNAAGSGAGRYNPAYYIVVGNVARPFHGVGVDYAMRIATAVACAVLLAWAASLWLARGRSRWRTLGLLTALTPVLLYSTAIAAPNGVAYAAGVLLWVGGLVLIRSTGSPARSPLLAVVVGAALVCNTHTTGPLWLLLIAIALIILEPARCLALLRHRRAWLAIAGVGIGGIASVAWTLISRANLSPPPDVLNADPAFGQLVLNNVVWLLQTIAAFPLRNESAPAAVYFLWLVPFAMLMALVVRLRGRVLAVTLWLSGCVILTATVLVWIAYRYEGYAWQGRYGLPLVVGLVLVPAAYAGDRRPYGPLFDCAVGAMVIATGISVWHVADHERSFVLLPFTSHVTGGPILAGALAALGFAVLAFVVRTGSAAVPGAEENAGTSRRVEARV